MLQTLLLALLAPTVGPLAPVATQDAPNDPFPTSTPIAEGVAPDAIEAFEKFMQGLVEDGEVVGAEVLLIKNGRSILHAGYGWSELETRTPMEPNSVFCVRSMTKPVIGAAILMLIEDDRLKLGDRVAEHLPSFDADTTRDITVEQLLTHTSGLPLSLLLARDVNELDGIRAVAELGAGEALEFPPGTGFHYSDQGTDTLTALIEVVSGMPADQFVRERVLEPLAMTDSACVLTEDHPLRGRALPSYAGSRNAWKPFWKPADPPLFSFFLGSQGLYSTTTDYARFLEFWRRRGRGPEERLLGPRFVRKALRPGPHPPVASTGFPELETHYGYLMQLWTDPRAEDDVVAFGHTGSDGTHAYAFPDEKAMALCFTQSRGNAVPLRIEEAISRVFLGAPFDPNDAAPPFEDYLGYYWEGEGDLYRAIVREGDDLALEILAQGVVPLTYAGGDRWKLRPDPRTVLEFQRSADGDVTGYRIGDHEEFRFEPADSLPEADELVQRVLATHRIDRLESLGPLRMEGQVRLEKHDIEGTLTTLLAWPDRFRFDSVAAGQFERSAFDGRDVRYATSITPEVTVASGRQAELMRRDHLLARLGDWRDAHPELEVVQRLQRAEEPGGPLEDIFLVRTGDCTAPASTFYVHSSGRVVREDGMAYVDTLGVLGQRVSYGDYRDVSGMLLPFRTEVEFANPMIGKISTTVDTARVGVELPAGMFELRE